MSAVSNPKAPLRRRAWRWHFLAALVVIPFVLWQSATGTLYLWSYAWVDANYPALRFVAPAAQRVSVEGQLEAARAVMPGSRVANVVISSEPRRSTQVMFENARGLPVAVFVDPYRGMALGKLDAPGWLPGWSKKLHGGWPAGKPGSWLLELGACWTIVMVLTGLALWWPRDGRSFAQVLVPRLRSGARMFWADLHACVAVWFSSVIVLFLFTALPWTSFWGDVVLRPLQRGLAQQAPVAAGFAPVMIANPKPDMHMRIASLQQMLGDARASGMEGDVLMQVVDGPPDAAVSLRSQRDRASQERYALYDRHDASRVGAADWGDFPPLARMVATGVDLHEGSYFGQAGPWLNTLFAASLVWLSITGLMAWWRRKPAHALGVPSRVDLVWPTWLKALTLLLCLLLPMLAISIALLWIAERLWLFAARWRRT
jgi:uncharacterized iron-regulated membrane protein